MKYLQDKKNVELQSNEFFILDILAKEQLVKSSKMSSINDIGLW